MLFRDGQRGVVIKLPGERPVEEIGELLGGGAEQWPARLSCRLALYRREDGTGLPERYELHRLGRVPEPVAGDCAVVAMGPDGRMKDLTVNDVAEAQAKVRMRGKFA